MDYGVFDHLDRGDLPLRQFYEARLELIESYEREGFYSYHLAEHHSTPLGMAPSPSVFLSAVAQRTRHLRFGPLVYALPLYHPLRLLEEICMLDQMSGGRLDIGFGRGSSPIELQIYGKDPADAQRVYQEGLELIMQGLTHKTLDFSGEFFSFADVPLELEPLQKPHPPIWYGVHSPESAERAARRALNIVSLDPAGLTRTFTDRFRQVWRECHGGDEGIPKMGISRFIVIADNDEQALRVARRAYPLWHRSFNHLFRLKGGAPTHQRPSDFDGVIASGQGIAGGPGTVRSFLESQISESGANYLIGQFAFGDISLEESLTSVALFGEHIMPNLEACY